MTAGPSRPTKTEQGEKENGASPVRPIDQCAYFDGSAFPCTTIGVYRDGVSVLARAGAPMPAPRSGVRLKLRLPTGFWVVGEAVVSVRTCDAAGRDGRFELDWNRLATHDRRVLEDATRDFSGGPPELPASMQIKHWVEGGEAEALAIALGGHLLEPDCQTLDSQLAACLARHKGTSTRLFLNAHGFRASPAPSLRRLRRVFGRLTARGPVLGLVTLGESVAATQLRRVLRDSGLGESLFACSAREDARVVWQRLLAADTAPLDASGRRPVPTRTS